MNRIAIFLLSLYFGLGGSFSFYMAPLLFDSLDKHTAGDIVEKVFPLYFGVGLGAVGISLLLSLTSKMPKFLTTLLVANLVILVLLEFYILPKAHALKTADSPEFIKMHLISVMMSTLSLFFTFGAIVYLIVKRDVGS